MGFDRNYQRDVERGQMRAYRADRQETCARNGAEGAKTPQSEGGDPRTGCRKRHPGAVRSPSSVLRYTTDGWIGGVWEMSVNAAAIRQSAERPLPRFKRNRDKSICDIRRHLTRRTQSRIQWRQAYPRF
jgi:hypothetical protein